MKKTWCLLWTPKYFRRQLSVSGSKKKPHGGPSRQEIKPVAPRAKSPKKKRATSSKRIVPSTFYMHPHFNTEATTADTTRNEGASSALTDLTTRAEGLLDRFTAVGGPSLTQKRATPNNVDPAAPLVFEAKRDVLGPLGGFLPAPSTVSSRRPTTTAGKRKPLGGRAKLKVVPDGAVEKPLAYLEHAPNRHPLTLSPSSMSKRQPAQLSLEQLVTLLRLYDLAESEDGLLLQQLFDELHRFFFVNVKQAQTASSSASVPPAQEDGRQIFVKLPLAPLLFMLSELSLVEEALLQHLTAVPHDEHDTSNNSSILLSQLPAMEERELLLLLVALFRFGLQNDPAFGLCVKRLRRLQWHPTALARDSNTSTTEYWRFLAKMDKQQTGQSKRPAVADAAAAPTTVTESSDPDNGATVLETLAEVSMPPQLTLPVALLLEVLTGLTLSLHRRLDVVQMVVRLLVANVGQQFANLAAERLSAQAQAGSGPSTEERETLSILARQVKRAIELCESMMYPQLILVELFAELREAAATGVLADGGELADIPSDRIVYYDHVTADLVKLRHVTS